MPVGHDSQSIAKREFRSGHSTQNEASAAGQALPDMLRVVLSIEFGAYATLRMSSMV
jgi:hypothetical protein